MSIRTRAKNPPIVHTRQQESIINEALELHTHTNKKKMFEEISRTFENLPSVCNMYVYASVVFEVWELLVLTLQDTYTRFFHGCHSISTKS